MLKLRQKVYLEYSYKSKGAKLTSAVVLWDWLGFFLPPLVYLPWNLVYRPHFEALPRGGTGCFDALTRSGTGCFSWRYELYLTFTYLSTSPLVEETYSIRLSQWWMPGWCTLSNQFSVLFMQEFGFVYHSSTIHGIFFDHASFFSIQFLCA